MFSDIHHWGFIGVAGHVAWQQQDCLILSPYQMALLQWGTRHRGEFDEAENPGVLLSMEYASSTTIIPTKEVTHINKHMLRAVVEMRESVNLANNDYGSLEVCFNEEVQKWRVVERTVDVLKDDAQTLQDEVQNLRGLFNDVLFHLADVESEVQDLPLFWAITQHGQNNPIIIDENDKMVVDSEDEWNWLAADEDDDKVEIAEEGEIWNGAVFPAGGILALIEDEEEDLRKPSRQVDCAEERPELMHRHLTMINVAFREAMETEQAAHIDPIPGYHSAPVYSEHSD